MAKKKTMLKLKVHINKKNSQGVVTIPKKAFGGKIPSFISVVKDDVFYKKKGGKK